MIEAPGHLDSLAKVVVDGALRLDLLIEDKIVVEVKAVEKIAPLQ